MMWSAEENNINILTPLRYHNPVAKRVRREPNNYCYTQLSYTRTLTHTILTCYYCFTALL